MNNKTLGQFIAELRKEKGFTQRELSEMLQVSDKTISHWERDESSPDISILPELSAIFGITVDELLKKEKNPPPCAEVIPPQSENDMKEKEKSEKNSAAITTEDRFRRYRLLSLVGTFFGALALVTVISSGTFLMNFFAAYTALDVTKAFPLLGAIKHIVFSLIASVAARIYFSHILVPKEETEEAPYIYKANRIFTLNLYLVFAVITFGIAPVIDIPYITLYGLTALITAVVIIAIDSLLKAKGLLMAKNEKLFRLRLVTIIVAAALILAGGGIWGFAEIWTPTPKELVFDSIDEFVAYMETPCEKPEEAWRIDGVEVTYVTAPPTAPLSTTQTTNPSPVQTLPSTTEPEYHYGSVFDFQNVETVTFRHLNGNVYRYNASMTDKKFHVHTYDEELKVKDWGRVQDTLSMVVPLYCVLVIVLSFIVYMKKAKKLNFKV
ncbi:MAG: helix-turn-helix domain-containing protein [Clostridia bacterium]|nr:helix-turn-helix domain-containing protein [Clostridia bacterium]